MELRTFREDDDAASPVVGVMLMVAITVILAAVIATFVLGLGQQVGHAAPQASFAFDFEPGADQAGDADCGDPSTAAELGSLSITHTGGATIDAARLSTTGSADPAANVGWDASCAFGASVDVTAGDGASFAVSDDDTIRVVWLSADGERSAQLATFVGPDA